MLRSFLLSLLMLVTFATSGASAAGSEPLPMDKAFALSSSSKGADLVLTWQIAEGYYLYRDQISIEDGNGKLLAPDLPKGAIKDDPGFGRTEVYFDRLQLELANGVDQKMQLTYQGCQDGGLCYPPRTVSLSGAQIMPAAQPKTGLQSSWQFSPAATEEPEQADASPKIQLADTGQTSGLETMLEQGGVIWVLLAFLGLGLLLAFTPCVLPIYPILAASLQRSGDTLTAKRGFVLASSYVLALALAFALFGIIAAKLGQNLQFALQTSTVTIILALIFVLLALSSFGLFELQLPQFVTSRFSRAGNGRRGTIAGAMLLGFSSALLIGPCVTAPLAGALLYIANQGDLMLGAAALFALGLGKGLPLIVLATCGAGLLPKAGQWMNHIRNLFGFLFLATALWQISRLLPDAAVLAGWAILLVTAGIFLGALDQLTPASGPRQRLAKATSLLAVFYGFLLAVGAASGATDPIRPLAQLRSTENPAGPRIDKAAFQSANSKPQLLQILSASQQPASLIYFTADWCVTCRSLERGAFRDAGVASALSGLNLVKVDLSRMTAENQALMNELQVVGPPTMLFVNQQNQEIAATRLVGDFDAAAITRAATISQTPETTFNSQKGSL